MSNADRPQGSLGQAHERIEGLMDELESTLELVKRLSETGEEEAALRLIDSQRAELYAVVSSLSSDVAVGRRGTFDSFRRHASVVVAAVVAALSTVAVSAGMFTRAPDPIVQATQQISRAETIADPAERLTRIITVYRVVTQTVPERADEIADDVLDEIQRIKDETQPEENPDLVKQAEEAANEIKEGRPPAPPSTEQSPVETVEDLIPKK